MKTSIRHIIVFLTAFLLYSCSDGLSDYQKKSFIKFYGSYQTDVGRDVQQLSTGGYALTGSMVPDSISKMFLIITDEYGNQTENSPNYYGGESQSVGRSLLVLDDGFLIAGQIEDTLADGTLHTDAFLVRTDAIGLEIWSKKLGGDSNESAYHVIKRTTGGYVIAGETQVNNQDNLWIVMIDENGDKIFDFLGNNGDDGDEAYYIHNTGSGYLVACTYDDGAFAGKDIMVLYLDENCNLSDARSMGTGFEDLARGIINFNGAYLVLGNSNNVTAGNNQINLYTFSLEGTLIKNQQSFATISAEGTDFIGEACIVSANGNIAIAGSQESNENRDMLLQFVDVNGVASEPITFGQLGSQSAFSIKRTLDGGLIFIGSNGLEGNSVISLVKTNASGEF